MCVNEPLVEAALGHPPTPARPAWPVRGLSVLLWPEKAPERCVRPAVVSVTELTPLTPGWADSRVVPLPTRLRSALPTLPDALAGAGDPSLRGTSTHFE